MGDEFRFRDVDGSGQVNIGRGGRNTRDDSRHHHVDNRGGTYVGGDVTAAPPEVVRDLEALHAVLGRLRLTDDERTKAASELAAARSAAADGPEQAAAPMRRFTEIVKEAGALASAGAALVEPLGRIARWLGPLGAVVLQLL